MLNIDLTGRVVAVTGGAKGIGGGVSKAFAQAGARVSILDMADSQDLVKEIQSAGGVARGTIADVTDSSQIQEAVRKTAEEYGAIDILVTCAGTTSRFPIEKMGLEEWEKILKINLTGTFNAVKAVLPYMLKQKRGVILLIGSAAIVAGSGGGVHYAASKAALEGLNRGLTKELAPKGIRSNLIHPSLIDTDLLRARHPDPAKRKEVIKEVPVGRLGKPEDIAHIAAFLASDLADYITGQSVFVDGGRTFCK